MKRFPALALAAALLLLSACGTSSSPSPSGIGESASPPPALSPSPSASPSASPGSTREPSAHGEGVGIYYSEAWDGEVAMLVLLGRVVGGEWEDWMLGSQTSDGTVITPENASEISGELPVLCTSPHAAIDDPVHLLGTDGSTAETVISDVFFRHWDASGISSIYVSVETCVFPAETPVLGFSKDGPDQSVIPMDFTETTGTLTADFDGDGQDETLEFEYIETASVVKRFLTKDGERTELTRLACKDFSMMYACAFDAEGDGRYWLFERNTEERFGYFAFSGWQNGTLDILVQMAV